MWISLQLAFPEKAKKDTKMELVLKVLQTSGISYCPLGWHSVGEVTTVFRAHIPKPLAKIAVSLLLVISPAYLIALIAGSSVF